MIYSMLVCPSGFFFFFSSLALPLSRGPGCPSLILSRWSVFLFDNLSIVHLIRLRVYGYLSICGDGNEMRSDRRLDLLYATFQSLSHPPPPTDLSCLIWVSELIHSAAYLISEAGLSYGQKKNKPIRSSSSQSEAIHIISQLTRTHISNWCSGWQVWSTKNLNAECGRFPLRASSLRFFILTAPWQCWLQNCI